MKRLIILLLLLLFPALSFVSCGNNSDRRSSELPSVYIDPDAVSGGDGTIESPYNSWSEVTFSAGYAYRQKRGTIARETLTLANISATAENPVVISDYGSGSLPVIQGSETETGWTLESGSIYSLTPTGSVDGPGMVAEDGTVLSSLTWDTDMATTFSAASAGSFSFDRTTGTIYVWCSSGTPSGHVMEVSRRLHGIHGDSSSHITIENIHVRYVSLHGIEFANSSNITVKGCTVEKLGGAFLFTAPPDIFAGNGIEFGNSSGSCLVEDTTINDIFDSGISPQTYESNQSASNFTFRNNTISRCGYAGIEVSVLYVSGNINSSIDGVSISDTAISDSGNGWSGIRYGDKGVGIIIDANSSSIDGNMTRTISNVSISDTTISGAGGEGIYLTGNSGTVIIRRTFVTGSGRHGIYAVDAGNSNLVLDLSVSVIKENGTPSGGYSGIAFNAPNAGGYAIAHNTISNNSDYNMYLTDASGPTDLTNNIFNTAVAAHLIVEDPLTSGSYISGNCFLEYVFATLNYDGTAYTTVTDMDAGVSESQFNNGAGDLLLNTDLTLQGTGSPCYQSGVTGSGIITDYAGNPYRTDPSSGAYEYYP
jgi:hypothetical protein